ncbi:hypothetical protein I7I48_04820 [Histoplasma ohiense]|nr:hypothetical protein I7I48_04820 [Histoplasma ohiense (nom. inval.)]
MRGLGAFMSFIPSVVKRPHPHGSVGCEHSHEHPCCGTDVDWAYTQLVRHPCLKPCLLPGASSKRFSTRCMNPKVSPLGIDAAR